MTHTQRGAVGLALLVLAGWSVPARAQRPEVEVYLTAAERLYENLEYERALEQVERAKRFSRGLTDDARIALWEGVLLADLGDPEGASAAFRAGLLLDPDGRLPVTVSPKISAEFEALREEVKANLAEAEGPAAQADAGSGATGTAAGADTGDAAATPRDGASAGTAASGAWTTDIDDPWAEASPDSPAFDPTASPSRQKPVVPLVLTGAAAASVLLGAFFGSQSGQEVESARDAVYQDQAVTHLQRAEDQAGAANIFYGAAGVAGVAAAAGFVLYTLQTAEEAP